MNGPPEPVFWVDENLGSSEFISRLRLAGLQVRAKVFPEGTKDVVWIPQIAEYGWVAITKDKLKADLDEQIALVLSGARVFVLVGDASHEELANLFIRRIKWVRKVLESRDEAFLGKIYVKGGETAIVSLTDLCTRSSRRWGRR
jgi:hypothetical protein